MTRRRGAAALTFGLVVAAALVMAAPPAAGEVAAASAVERVVVIGIPGLRWADVDERRTPAMAQMHRDGASGVLSVKTAAARDCEAAGWLTLGAGNRVNPAGPEPAGCTADLPSPTTLPDQVRSNADRREGAMPGALAQALRQQGSCVGARGAGAELAAADPQGDLAPTVLAREPCPVLLRAEGRSEGDALLGSELRSRAPGTVILLVGLSEPQGDGAPICTSRWPSALVSALAVWCRRRPGELRTSSWSTSRRPCWLCSARTAPPR